MIERCPICSLRLDLSKTDESLDTCMRCQSELALLQNVMSSARQYLQRALSASLAQDKQAALYWAQKAIRLHATPLGLRLAAYF